MVNLDNYEQCDSEHTAACRCVVGKAIFMRYENQLERVEEWSSGWISRLTRDQLESLGGTFYKPKEKFKKEIEVGFDLLGTTDASPDAGNFVRWLVADDIDKFEAVANRRYKITVEEL